MKPFRPSVCPSVPHLPHPDGQKIKMRRTLFPSLAVPATFVHELKREALACECCCVFIHSFVHSFIHPFIHTSAPEPPASPTQQRLSFSFTSPLLSIRLSHTEHEVHARTHTYGARGANHHRPLTGPVCEWEIFFFFSESAAAPAALPGQTRPVRRLFSSSSFSLRRC